MSSSFTHIVTFDKISFLKKTEGYSKNEERTVKNKQYFLWLKSQFFVQKKMRITFYIYSGGGSGALGSRISPGNSMIGVGMGHP
jgi:hypothetical protein